jgi:glycosyltransferase involved in cell wall biosynthesis
MVPGMDKNAYHLSDPMKNPRGKTMRVAIIIPAFNEETTIADVVAGVPNNIAEQVIVVDNASTDATAELAQSAGARVVHEPNKGYGAACYAGFRAAEEAEVVVFMDGDGVVNPAQIQSLLDPISSDEADLVLGSRTLGKRDPGALLIHARFGNWLAAQLMRWLYGLRVTDLGPFRAIRANVLREWDMQEMTYGWPTEMMVKSAKRGYRVVEIPVDYYRRAGGVSKISGTLRGTILAGYYIIGTTVKNAFGS